MYVAYLMVFMLAGLSPLLEVIFQFIWQSKKLFSFAMLLVRVYLINI